MVTDGVQHPVFNNFYFQSAAPTALTLQTQLPPAVQHKFEHYLKFFFIFLFFYSCFMSTCNHMGYDRPTPGFYIHAWPKAPYFITCFAFSRRNLFVAFGIPLLSLALSSQLLVLIIWKLDLSPVQSVAQGKPQNPESLIAGYEPLLVLRLHFWGASPVSFGVSSKYLSLVGTLKMEHQRWQKKIFDTEARHSA